MDFLVIYKVNEVDGKRRDLYLTKNGWKLKLENAIRFYNSDDEANVVAKYFDGKIAKQYQLEVGV